MATKELPTGTVITPVTSDHLLVYDASDGNRIKDILISGLQTLLNTEITMGGALILKYGTIAADDTTPSVSGGNVFTTSANTGATAITSFDDATQGQFLIIIGGSNTNSSTIADSGNFNLSAAWTASLDDVLILYVQGATDFIEIARANN
jgi:hypothetical protein